MVQCRRLSYLFPRSRLLLSQWVPSKGFGFSGGNAGVLFSGNSELLGRGAQA